MAAVYIDPDAGSDGAGTEGDPKNTWVGVTFTGGNSYLQKRGTTYPAGITVNASGTAGNVITLGAYGTGAKPKITNASGSGITCAGYNYVTITDIEASDCSVHGFALRGSNQTITDCEAHRNGTAGFLVGLTSSFSNMTFTRCTAIANVRRGFGSVSSTGSLTVSDISFIDCVAGDTVGAGSPSGGLDLIFNSAGAATSTLSNITVRGGRYYNNNGAGVYIAQTADAFPGASTYYNGKVTIENVELDNNGDGGLMLIGSTDGIVRRCRAHHNGWNSTLGGLWTGRNVRLLLEDNDSWSNITTGIDGAGIFDDQFNDGCIFQNNRVWDNLGDAALDEWNGFGIACFNSRNSTHRGNVCWGNRYNAHFGNASQVNNKAYGNTYVDSVDSNVVVWEAGSEVDFRNNVVLGGKYACRSNTAFTISSCAVSGWTVAERFNVNTTLTDNVTDGPELSAGYMPAETSPIVGAGVHIAYGCDANGVQRFNPPTIGAIEPPRARSAASARNPRV